MPLTFQLTLMEAILANVQAPDPVHSSEFHRPLMCAAAEMALRCALTDGKARTAGVLLIDPFVDVPNHYSMPYGLGNGSDKEIYEELRRAKELGFSIVKFKVNEYSTLGQVSWAYSAAGGLGFQVRLDMNARLSYFEVEKLLLGLQFINSDLSHLDWIEDPFPFDAEQYRQLKDQFGKKIAIDFVAPIDKVPTESADVAIFKPGIQHIAAAEVALEKGFSVCVTSMLDHPLGQLWAHFQAQSLLKTSGDLDARVVPGGIASHFAYKSGPFSDQLLLKNTSLMPVQGTGLGFDDQLGDLEWTPI